MTPMTGFKKVFFYLRIWWLKRSESTRELPGFLWNAVRNFLQRGARQSAALSYYAVFSIFPLVLLLAVAVGNLLEPAVAQQQIANGLKLFMPAETADMVQLNIAEILQQSPELGLIAVLALIWSALGLFSNITFALDTIFYVPSMRSMWRQRLLAFGMTVTLVVLVGASFLTSGVLRLVSAFLLNQPSIWVTIGTLFLPLGLNVVIFALLFRYVPSRHVHWDAVWPAAVVGAIGWELAKVAFAWYITNLANYSVVYGGLATGIVLLFWAYIMSSVFLFSAELCAQLNAWFIGQEERERKSSKQIQISFQGGQIRVHAPTEGPTP